MKKIFLVFTIVFCSIIGFSTISFKVDATTRGMNNQKYDIKILEDGSQIINGEHVPLVDMEAFEQLANEVERGEILSETEAETRYKELENPERTKRSFYGSMTNLYSNAAEYSAIVWYIGYSSATKAKTDSDKAVNAGAAYGGAHNGKGDALRHSYWNALMGRDIGMYNTKVVADLHEQYNPGPALENQMDYINNEKGRNAISYMIGQKMSTTDSSIKSWVIGDMNKGYMVYIKNNKLVYTNQ